MGGRRTGSGRKRKPGERDSHGRLMSYRDVCACGQMKSKVAAQCQPCSGAAKVKALPAQVCVVCQQPFTKANRTKTLTCGPVCCAQRRKQEGYLLRLSNDAPRWRTGRIKHSRPEHRRGRKYSQWPAICERDGWVCWICGGDIDPAGSGRRSFSPSVDHVVPVSLGGSDDDDNLRAAHYGCNARRAAKVSPEVVAHG